MDLRINVSSKENSNEGQIKFICPSAEELKNINNQVQCEKCNLVFSNESTFRMHYLKVHEQKNLEKSHKENTRFNCPVKNCIYAPGNKKNFTLFKYLKQHYLKVHAEKKFTCTRCTKSYSTNAAKEAHVRICGINFICSCEKVYNSLEALLTHAKRSSHEIDEKYKSKKGINNKNNKQSNNLNNNNNKQNKPLAVNHQNIDKLIYILPKPTTNACVQTDEVIIRRKSRNKTSRSQVCRQTQTTEATKEKYVKKSAETQTSKTVPRVFRVRKVEKRKKISVEKDSIIRENISVIETLTSEDLLPHSPLSIRNDLILHDLWEERSSLGTQTSPEKNIFGDIEDYNSQGAIYRGITRSDPMLTEETYANRFSSIETQTEKAYCQSLFESDPISSHNETQTTDNFTEATEPLHIYNNTYTQTCDEIFSSDLGLSDIQTQTAWSHLDESTVSTETQTKAFKCLSGCNDSSSWFTTQMNHMETQTDLFNIFEELG